MSGGRSSGPLRASRCHVVLAATSIVLSLAGCSRSATTDPERSTVASGRGLNLVMVSLDTLRADRLGCYGYARATSPNLDRLAEEGVRFSRAISQAPWTVPSHVTLFTSLYPSAHGVNRGVVDFRAHRSKGAGFRALAPGVTTLAAELRRSGYETVAITGGGTMAPGYGLERGFDEYLVESFKLNPRIWADLRAQLTRKRSQPFFLFFHTFEVHAPYTHLDFAADALSGAQATAMAEELAKYRDHDHVVDAQGRFLASQGLATAEVTSSLYDGGVLAAGRFIGTLLEELRALGLDTTSLLVILSDHGEEFGEHDANRFFNSHCHSQYEELLRVPLVMRFPPLVGRAIVVDQPVGLIDVAPTVLDLLDIPIPSSFQGRSLKSALSGGGDNRGFALSEGTCIAPEIKAIQTARHKYIATFALGPDEEHSWREQRPVREEVYDLLLDPRERRNQVDQRGDLAALLRSLFLQEIRAHTKRRFDDETHFVPDESLRRQLEALGYL